MKTHPLPTYLQRFFTERLGTQLKASPNTVSSYRDTFRLLLKYAADQLRRPPTELQVVDIDADLIGLFLADIESTRGNSARSRNDRYADIGITCIGPLPLTALIAISAVTARIGANARAKS
jgi:integrase/recombinase XerD